MKYSILFLSSIRIDFKFDISVGFIRKCGFSKHCLKLSANSNGLIWFSKMWGIALLILLSLKKY